MGGTQTAHSQLLTRSDPLNSLFSGRQPRKLLGGSGA